MKKRGFTLIELMIVISIVGLLAAISIPKFAGVADSAKVANIQGNLSSMRISIAMYNAKNGTYPGLMGKEDNLGSVIDSTNKEAIAFSQFYGKESLVNTPGWSSESITIGDTNEIEEPKSKTNLIASKDGGWVYEVTLGDIRADIPDESYGDNIDWSEF